MNSTPLKDRTVFALVNGLWKGVRAPFVRGFVLRSTNFVGDGRLEYSTAAEMDVELSQVDVRRLKSGDVLIERSGGGPKQPVGRVAYFQQPDDHAYFASNFTTGLRVVDQEKFDPRFVALFLHALYLAGKTESLQRATTGIRNLDWQEYLNFSIPEYPLAAQGQVVELIGGVQAAYGVEESLLETLSKLKHRVMGRLFTSGLRGEPQKETELGLVPEPWTTIALGALCGKEGIRTGPFGSQLHSHEYVPNGVPVVNPTHLAGNRIDHRKVPRIPESRAHELARHRLQEGDILFARRGGIGRIGLVGASESGWLCGTGCFVVRVCNPAVDNRYLAHYFGTKPVLGWLAANAAGAIMPNLNSLVLSKTPIMLPPIDEQREIVTTLDTLDRKIDLCRRKRESLSGLFEALLHKLMLGEIRVSGLDLSAYSAGEAANAA